MMDSILEYSRNFLQQPALALNQAEFMMFAGLVLFLFIAQSKSTMGFYHGILRDKDEILQRQHDELERRRSHIEDLEKVVESQQKLIKDLSSAGVIHRIVVDVRDGEPTATQEANAQPLKRVRH